MKTFLVYGKNKSSVSSLAASLRRLGFEPAKRPDFVVSVGGDGTYLYSEREYPGIPKLLIRDQSICQKCSRLEFDELFLKLHLKSYKVIENIKLEAVVGGRKLTATNDFVIRNRECIHAIRFRVQIDKRVAGDFIGDGIVAATPFGSSGYFSSIARKTFHEGIGLAFNNTTSKAEHMVLHENSVVRFSLLRHMADFAADNNPKTRTLRPGRQVTIRKSRLVARLIRII